MIEILLYVSSGLIIIGYIYYFFIILLGTNQVVSNSDSFDVTKDIIAEYNSINVIESSGYFTIYNLKRKVIRLATKCYYGRDLSSVSLALTEAGISIIDNKKNKYLEFIGILFNNLKILYIIPLIVLFINNSSFNVSDAKISIFLVVLCAFISYILIEIKSDAVFWVSNNINKIKDIKKDKRNKIINFMDKLILFDKFIFWGELIVIIRLFLLLFFVK